MPLDAADLAPHVSTMPFPPATTGAIAAVMIPLVAELDAGAASKELTRERWLEAFDRACDAIRELGGTEERGAWLEPVFVHGARLGCRRE